MTDDFSNRLAGWLTPASLQLTVEQLEIYQLAVRDVADKGPTADLVEAAHGILSDEARARLARAVVARDPTFVSRDKDELLTRLAGASIMLLLEREAPEGTTAALLIQSARFIGLTARLDELPRLADAVVNAAGAATRLRNHVARSGRKTLAEGADVAEAVSVVNSVLRRTYDTLADMDKRLELMDEEVNALWWARAQVSHSKGVRWDSMEPLDRVLTASLELQDIIAFYPPTAAQSALLKDVGGDDSGEVSLTHVGKALRSTEVAEKRGGSLLPLVTAANLWREHDGDSKVVGALLKKAGFDPKQEFALRDIGEQLWRESHLADSQ